MKAGGGGGARISLFLLSLSLSLSLSLFFYLFIYFSNHAMQECEHVSDREEDFFALQCTVKNKRSVVESLQSFVAGEMLDGENKYHCEKCKKKVTAMKRVCVKSLPPVLILHLKRIEFDFELLERIKVNDECQFEHLLDMEPYTVEFLSNNTSDAQRRNSCQYRLSGVLVHRGTAQSGHYYSFIREREGQLHPGQWLFFNDETVEPMSPHSLPYESFGGLQLQPYFNSAQQIMEDRYVAKNNNAYLLFYDRIAAPAPSAQPAQSADPADEPAAKRRKQEEQPADQPGATGPAAAQPQDEQLDPESEPRAKQPRLDASAAVPETAMDVDPPATATTTLMPPGLQALLEQIWADNAEFLSDCYVFNKGNFEFVLETCQQATKAQAEPTARLQAMQVGIGFLACVLAHARERAELPVLWNCLQNLLNADSPVEPVCATWTLDFFLSHQTQPLGALLFQSPHADIRGMVVKLLLMCMHALRPAELQAYEGWQPTPLTSSAMAGPQPAAPPSSRILSVIYQTAHVLLPFSQSTWTHLHEVFLLLAEFVKLGLPEARFAAQHGILDKAIEFFVGADSPFGPPANVPRPLSFVDHMTNAPYRHLLMLVVTVLHYVDRRQVQDPEHFEPSADHATHGIILPPATVQYLTGDGLAQDSQDPLPMSFLALQLEQELDLPLSCDLIQWLCVGSLPTSKRIIESLCTGTTLYDAGRILPFLQGIEAAVNVPDELAAQRAQIMLHEFNKLLQSFVRAEPVCFERVLVMLTTLANSLPAVAQQLAELKLTWFPEALFHKNRHSVREAALQFAKAQVDDTTRAAFQQYVEDGRCDPVANCSITHQSAVLLPLYQDALQMLRQLCGTGFLFLFFFLKEEGGGEGGGKKKKKKRKKKKRRKKKKKKTRLAETMA